MEKEYHVVQKTEVLSLPKVLEQKNEVSSKKQDSKSTRHERETFQQQQKKVKMDIIQVLFLRFSFHKHCAPVSCRYQRSAKLRHH